MSERAVMGDFEAYLTAGEVTFDARDVALLRAIDAEGSLNAAAGNLGRSYSRAHARIAVLEEQFGSLTEPRRGGSGGGGSVLTPGAHELLARFERLRTAVSGTVDVPENVLDGHVTERDGELAVVETDAGIVRALAPTDTAGVQVAVRADAITLHTPAGAPPAAGTSARNRFRGTVSAIDRGIAVARVLIDVDGHGIAALVTDDSLERLRVESEDPIVVTFKATATRATPQP